MSYRILISDPLSEEGIFPLREADNIEIAIETDLTNDQLLERINDFDALLVRSQTQVTKEVIAQDRKSTRLNSSHVAISYAVFCLKKKKKNEKSIIDIT